MTWILGMILLGLPVGVRSVQATSCEIIPVRVALGMTSQVVFEQPPSMTLHADEEHFKIKTNPDAKRSIAIIPFVDAGVVGQLFPSQLGSPKIPSEIALAKRLDEHFATNLFVFFKHANQLSFKLHFVPKNQADNILKVKQIFRRDCQL